MPRLSLEPRRNLEYESFQKLARFTIELLQIKNVLHQPRVLLFLLQNNFIENS